MSKLLTVLFLILFMSKAEAQSSSDTAKHFGAGILIGGAGGYAAHKLFNEQNGWSWVGAVGSSLGAALAKEALYDQPNGAEWENRDIIFTTLGGVVSGFALDLILRNDRRNGGGGTNCGCLVVRSDLHTKTYLPKVFENGTADISSELQAAYFLR